jgi:hypothetical protein
MSNLQRIKFVGLTLGFPHCLHIKLTNKDMNKNWAIVHAIVTCSS